MHGLTPRRLHVSEGLPQLMPFCISTPRPLTRATRSVCKAPSKGRGVGWAAGFELEPGTDGGPLQTLGLNVSPCGGGGRGQEPTGAGVGILDTVPGRATGWDTCSGALREWGEGSLDQDFYDH